MPLLARPAPRPIVPAFGPAFAAIAIAIAFAGTPARAAQYVVVAGAPSRVVFESKAPSETFMGSTHQVSGAVELDPAQIADVLTARIEVEMASFTTGIPLRDKHMRDNHLHTDRHPRAVFTGGRLGELSQRVLGPGERVTGVIEGELELHGVTKPVSARFEMTLEGAVLRIVARFGVTLADHEIPRPRFLWMKLGETQAVTVDLVARER